MRGSLVPKPSTVAFMRSASGGLQGDADGGAERDMPSTELDI